VGIPSCDHISAPIKGGASAPRHVGNTPSPLSSLFLTLALPYSPSPPEPNSQDTEDGVITNQPGLGRVVPREKRIHPVDHLVDVRPLSWLHHQHEPDQILEAFRVSALWEMSGE
jgi:hypothetical protein